MACREGREVGMGSTGKIEWEERRIGGFDES
jgi:hypothetical protein